MALPKTNMPNVDTTLSMTGTGFRSLIARGRDEPPRRSDAARASSTP